ncbi:MAG: type 4a pilus biogenesis protein PilO [Candidatus Omnitrophica bacterium]|nr:type 4a pilus biogenesis protein PilO [Candidatus Omnitrophota bacterium]
MGKFSIDFAKNKKQTAILITLVAVAAFILYLNLMLLPQLSSLGDNFKKIARLDSDLREAERDVSTIGNLERGISVYDEKIEQYVKMLPAEKEIPALLENLASMARDANVRIVAITPVTGKETEGEKGRIYLEMPIQISAKSGFHELGRFMSSLESSGRFMKVLDIEIKGNPSTPKRHDVDLLLTTYVLVKGK